MHGVGTWHGAGPVIALKSMLQRVVDFEHEEDLVKKTLNLKEKAKSWNGQTDFTSKCLISYFCPSIL